MLAEEKPIPRWQRVAALAIAALVVGCLIVFRHRLGADFVPLDASRVGPNLIASALTWAALFVLAVLLWPPWRRRLHRFVDRKIAPLHAKVDALHARHDEHAASLALLHEKLDRLGPGPHPQPDPAVPSAEAHTVLITRPGPTTTILPPSLDSRSSGGPMNPITAYVLTTTETATGLTPGIRHFLYLDPVAAKSMGERLAAAKPPEVTSLTFTVRPLEGAPA
jgi:hypothetical protein